MDLARPSQSCDLFASKDEMDQNRAKTKNHDYDMTKDDFHLS